MMKSANAYLCLFLFLILLASDSPAQNYNWITPSKTYLKMYVISDGVYRINKIDFTNAGIPVTSIDPRTIKVYNNGNQIPIYFSGEADGTFNDNDFFDFYGERIYGGLTQTYYDNTFPNYVTNEYYNLYSDTNVYYADWGGAAGLRFSVNTFSTTTPYPSAFFTDTLHFEQDKIYTLGENVSSADYRYLLTQKFSGEGWYWSMLSNTGTLSDTFSVRQLYTDAPTNSSIRIFAYPQNADYSIPNEHTIEIRVNGTLASTLSRENFNRFDTTITFPTSFLSGSSVNNIQVKYLSASGFDGRVYYDLFELHYPKKFVPGSNRILSASLSNADTTSKLFKFPGVQSGSNINFYDVRNNIRISNYTFGGDTLKFTGKSNARFELVNDTVRMKPLRMKQRQVPALASSTNGADYLIVYHSSIQSQAEQLRAYRQTSDGYRSVKAEIEDIYDIFNYGKEDPAAVRNFVKHVYDTWQLPKLKYINLFGRGSLDPKKNKATSVYEKNFVPVYGNPPSDGYFANFTIGTFFYNPHISVGRLPAYTASEAQVMVDKIIAYENEPPAEWGKMFTFITGGSTYLEQQSYQSKSNFEINSLINARPISGEGIKIYRSDTSGNVTFNYADSIKNSINRGTLYVNFRGHAGSRDWEVGMRDPQVLNNGNKLPFVLSLTCFTGENANSEYRGFGEKFLYLPGKGAVAFIGTTGWSFASTGNDFGAFITSSFKTDSLRKPGEMVVYTGNYFVNDSTYSQIRHTVNCYNLLGDPAVKLNLPKVPEFVIGNNDYKLDSESIVLGEPASFKIFPKNFGTYADSCRIRFLIKKNNVNYISKDTVYKAFRFLDTVGYRYQLDTPGVFTMTVTLDANNFYAEKNENNNSITFNLPYNEYAFLPVNPVNNSVVYKDTAEFSCLNPSINFSSNSVKVVLQVDTSKNFNSPVLKTFVNTNPSGVTTKFKSRLGVLTNNTLYYWRTNSVINNDSTGWTGYRNFVFKVNTPVSKSDGGLEPDSYGNTNQRTYLYKFKPDQFPSSDLSNVTATSNGLTLDAFPATLYVRSYGSNGEEASYFSVGQKNIYIDGGKNSGLNLIKVRKVSGSILQFKNFKMNTAQSSDSLVQFLNTFDSTQYLMLLNAAYFAGGQVLDASAKSKLRQFGSVYCDSIHLLSYFHTWSFIGSLGASGSQVSEMFDPCCRTSPTCTGCDHWSESISTMDVVFMKTSGTVSNIIGPAKSWTQMNWDPVIPTGSSLEFDIYGIDNGGGQFLLKQNLQSYQFTELSSINASEFPKLNIVSKFKIDSLTGNASPLLRSISMNYSSASEMLIDKNSLTINSAVTDRSEGSAVSFNMYNAGFNQINGVIVNFYNGPVSDSLIIATDTIKQIMKPDSMLHYSRSILQSALVRSAAVNIYVRPRDHTNELYTFNNKAGFEKTVIGTGNISGVEVYIDGRLIGMNEQTVVNPMVKVLLKNENTHSLTDTSALSIILNNNYVSYFMNGSTNPVLRKAADNNQSASVDFSPVLNEGKNELMIVYRNDEGSRDTTAFELFVSGEMSVGEIYNFPNPMTNETSFMVDVAGLVTGDQFKIKIYTISGRLIRELEFFPQGGTNQIPWDGRDSDGDVLANGTYLYKLVYDNKELAESKVQKLVILR